MAVYSSQFYKIEISIGGAAYVDISPWTLLCDDKRTNKPTDVTTFAANGGPVTKNIVRGALQAPIVLKMLQELVPCKLMRQVIATRTGFNLRISAGSNALPTQGDEVFTMSATCLSYTHPYHKDTTVVIDYGLFPVDGGSINPAFGSI